MSNKKKVGIFFVVVLGFLTTYYSYIYIKSQKNNVVVEETNITITDINEISSDKVDAVKNCISYYELDSNNKFNPKDNLNRIDSIILIDKIAKKINPKYLTQKPTIVPYFEDYSSSDTNSEAILRVVNLIDNKENFLKHYNILGYKLNRQESITKREFLTLLAVFVPANPDLGSDYILKNLINYGFSLGDDLDTPISREDSAVYVNMLLNTLNNN